MLAHESKSAERILGDVDAMKFRSCLTLFEAIEGDADGLFGRALAQFYAGSRDEATLKLLAGER